MSPGKGRPKLTGEQRNETRQRIAAAASQLFIEEGYSAVSMRRLAKEVGLTPMALYRYYDHKIDILKCLWIQVFDVVFQKIGKSVARHKEPRKKLDAAAKAYVKYWLKNPEHYRMVFMSEGVGDPEVSAFIGDSGTVEKFQIFLELIAVCTQIQDSKKIKELGDLLICSLTGIIHSQTTLSGYDWTKPNILVESAVSAILDSAQSAGT